MESLSLKKGELLNLIRKAVREELEKDVSITSYAKKELKKARGRMKKGEFQTEEEVFNILKS